MKKLCILLIGFVALTLAACGSEEDTSTLSEDKLVVGSMAGEQAEISNM